MFPKLKMFKNKKPAATEKSTTLALLIVDIRSTGKLNACDNTKLANAHSVTHVKLKKIANDVFNTI